MDPGYVPLPKNNKILSPEQEIEDNRESHHFIDVNEDDYTKDLPEWNRDIIIDPDNAPSNFCWRCKFVRPIRSKHCYDCDRCVAKFDHHCPMVGNCVGGRNHRYFLLFMLTQTVVVVWAFYMALNLLFKMDLLYSYRNSQFIDENTDDRSVAGWIFRILFFICMFFALFVVVGLSGFHCYLASTNQTTYEMIKPQVAEKWRDEEEKRKNIHNKKKEKIDKKKRKKDKKNNKKNKIVDKDDDSNDDIELGGNNDDDYDNKTNSNDKSKGNKKGKGNKSKSTVRKYGDPVTFDKGFCKNIMMFCTGDMQKNWEMPLQCVLKDSDTEESDY